MREANNLTTFMCPYVMEIWEPKPLGTLWATPGLLRDSFTYLQADTRHIPSDRGPGVDTAPSENEYQEHS